MTASRKRADLLLVERGLFESRARAQAAIAAGLVTAGGKTVAKSSETIPEDAALLATPAHPWVSRGGVKLAGALEQYPIDIEDHVCLDVGASTGGFTEVLLSQGASLVFPSMSAVDNCTRACTAIRASSPWKPPISATMKASDCRSGRTWW